MTVADLMWLLLLLAVASSLLSSAWPKAMLHDPISAILAGVLPEALAAGGLEAGLGAGIAGEAGLAGGLGAGLGAVDAVLPEVAVGALAPEAAAGGLEAGLGGLGAFAGAADVLPGLEGLGGFGSSAAEAGGSLAAGAGGLSTAAPGASTLTGVAPLGTAATPTAAAPPAEFAAAGEAGAGGAVDPLASLAGSAQAPVEGGGLSGPVSGTGSLADTFGGSSTVGAGTADAGGGSSGLLSKVGLGGVSDFMKDNKDLLSIGGAVLPLASMLFSPKPNIPGLNAATANSAALTRQGQNLSAEGQALQGNAMAGVLPPGFEAAIEQAKNAATTRVGNRYGDLGLSGSTSEAVDRANVAAAIDAQRAPILEDLISKGITASGAGVNALGAAGGQDLELAKIQIAQDDKLQKALQSLASNLVLGSMPARTISIS